MARYKHLPIYKKAKFLTVYFEKIVRNFSRYNKYTVGSELTAFLSLVVMLPFNP
jgi:hypothetical protein